MTDQKDVPRQCHEDNFGWHDLSFPLEAEFVADLIARSRWTVCRSCKARVLLLLDRKVCATCAYEAEMGWTP